MLSKAFERSSRIGIEMSSASMASKEGVGNGNVDCFCGAIFGDFRSGGWIIACACLYR